MDYFIYKYILDVYYGGPIYENFMVNGCKIIPENIVEWLSPRALAFWSMDGGFASLSESGRALLS